MSKQTSKVAIGSSPRSSELDILFYIDGKARIFSACQPTYFFTGSSAQLSQKDTDISYGLPWYEAGYIEEDFLEKKEFQLLKNGIAECIKSIINRELSINTDKFSLEKYHKFVTSNKDHFKIVSKTRNLFPEDFNFPIQKLTPRLAKLLGFSLTEINPRTQEKVHIIVRINRPRSTDYNPPHKDIYADFDKGGHISKFINFWIPIAGVNEKTSLPIAPASHLVDESKISRTHHGGTISGNRYRVVIIKHWGSSNHLVRSKVNYGQALIFSSHLVHGLAINDETDITRVSLEFRLFKG